MNRLSLPSKDFTLKAPQKARGLRGDRQGADKARDKAPDKE